MTINERIKFMRKEKKWNQAQFAAMLGVTQSGISYMEQPGSTIADSTIKTICALCNLNEDWLRHGIEPMYLESDTFSLDDFAKKNGASELDLKAIRAYFEIDAGVRQSLLEHFIQCFVEPSDISPYDDAPDTPEELERLYPPIEDDDDLEVG